LSLGLRFVEYFLVSFPMLLSISEFSFPRPSSRSSLVAVAEGRERTQGAVVSASTLRARFPPTVWRPPRGRIQDHMARTRSAGAEATTALASIPPLASEPANPSASVVQPSAGPVPGRAPRR
jgi:hypothetical protein